MLRTAQETAAGRVRQTNRDSGKLAEDPRTWRLDDPCRIAPSGQMVTTSECRSRWLRAPATTLLYAAILPSMSPRDGCPVFGVPDHLELNASSKRG